MARPAWPAHAVAAGVPFSHVPSLQRMVAPAGGVEAAAAGVARTAAAGAATRPTAAGGAARWIIATCRPR